VLDRDPAPPKNGQPHFSIIPVLSARVVLDLVSSVLRDWLLRTSQN